jgi:energy-coupling factor transport system substrate-specific component
MGKASTAYLLTCAAIGVAGGVVLAAGWWLSLALFATVPFATVAIADLWVIPPVVALRLLQRPFAGLLVGLISGSFSPRSMISAVATTLFWAFFPELPFLVTLYRRWATWLHYAGAALIGVAYPILAAQSFDLWSMATPCSSSSSRAVRGILRRRTALAILIADRLRAAGVARLARHRAAV